MDNNADSIVNNWLSSQKQKTSVDTDPADAIVSRWLTKQQGGSPHALDDSSVNSAQNDLNSQDYNGLCERFVEQKTYGKSGLYPSAADAWNSYMQNGQAYSGNVDKAPVGSLIYFSPDQSNNGDGHVGIADGKGNFISATSNGVMQMPINSWIKTTGQKPLGYVTP